MTKEKLANCIVPKNLKIVEIYQKIDFNILNPAPSNAFNSDWNKETKLKFIQTILQNYPFPAVYTATVGIDLNTLKNMEIVVDGKQRLSAVYDYIKGGADFENQTEVPTFDSLTAGEKKDFLNYSVTVIDFGELDLETVKNILRRMRIIIGNPI